MALADRLVDHIRRHGKTAAFELCERFGLRMPDIESALESLVETGVLEKSLITTTPSGLKIYSYELSKGSRSREVNRHGREYPLIKKIVGHRC